MIVYKELFDEVIRPESLFLAWDLFKRGKGRWPDVIRFERDLEQHIFALHRELRDRTYRHGPYSGFYVHDPKRRHIHKALVRDRVVHHAVFRILNYVFDPTFIASSFSCRLGKGTHRGVQFLAETIRRVSQNYTRPCFVLKCDIAQFFHSVDQQILLELIGRKIKDADLLWLLQEIVTSYPPSLTREREREEYRLAI